MAALVRPFWLLAWVFITLLLLIKPNEVTVRNHTPSLKKGGGMGVFILVRQTS